MSLHRAEQKGYRELYLSAREARTRLDRLAEALPQEAAAPVARASSSLGELVDELRPATAKHDLHAELAADGGGARIGMVRSAILDRFLERNQALRFAVDDLEHVTTLLGYLSAISEKRRHKQLAELCESWERRMRRQVGTVRKVAIGLGDDPDGAIELLDPTEVAKLARTAS